MKTVPMFLYCCADCVVMFGVEQAFEDQSVIVCPSCGSDHALEDAGSGVLNIESGPEGGESND